MKYIGRPAEGSPWVRITLRVDESSNVMLSIGNSKGTPLAMTGSSESGGLGSRLITAFGQQLQGEVQVKDNDDSYFVELRFRVSDFETAAREP